MQTSNGLDCSLLFAPKGCTFCPRSHWQPGAGPPPGAGAMSSAASPLLRCVEQREATVQLQLICFPHAGGSASSYNTWTSLPDIIEVWVVQPPGRGARAAEPAFESLASYAEAVVDALQPLHGPLAFFGHSFGSLVALKAAQTLHSRGLPLPLMLAVSGHGAPGDGLPAAEAGLCALSDLVRRIPPPSCAHAGNPYHTMGTQHACLLANPPRSRPPLGMAATAGAARGPRPLRLRSRGADRPRRLRRRTRQAAG